MLKNKLFIRGIIFTGLIVTHVASQVILEKLEKRSLDSKETINNDEGEKVDTSEDIEQK